MLRPHPTVLRRLVEEYEALTAARGGPAGPDPRTADLAYTLCVTTGTRDVRHALVTARGWLATAGQDAPGAGTPAAV
ncbi:DUF5133 domain-containing protein [Streptomyces sp. NPDC018955]|uniref:DUF5133 domain-containing protein n=1 Tax=Streptomyces sp. NPDC018955 TaxID=3365055 RepID=UPI00379915CE